MVKNRIKSYKSPVQQCDLQKSPVIRPHGLVLIFSNISAQFMDIPSWRSVEDFTGKLFWLLSASNIARPGIKSSSTEIWTIKIHSTGLIHTVTRHLSSSKFKLDE